MIRLSRFASATAGSLALAAALGVGALMPSAVLAQAQQNQNQAPDGAQAGSPRALAAVQDLSEAFRNVGKEIAPSVVSIKIRKTIEPSAGRMAPGENPFRRFFGPGGPGGGGGGGGDEGDDDSGGGMPGMPGIPGLPGMPFGGEEIGEGSGVIMAVDGNTGYIVTNNHVAGDADEMEISLNDGRSITNAKLVGKDPRTDLAVVKIDASNLKAAKWGNSDSLQKGDWVLAFGAPFGYVGSMTHGIVSATNRTDLRIIPQGYEQFIQIDAPINPGNSGGPLVNIHGEVVGINTAIASRTGGFQGIGFAIPSSQAQQITTILREKGKVVRGWLGVSIASVSDPEFRDVAKSFGYQGDKGVLVQQIFPNTPASGKLQEGDIITAINGKPVDDSNQLRNQIAMMPPGTDVKMDVFRNGKQEQATVKLGDQPSNLASLGQPGVQPEPATPPGQSESPKIGVQLENLTPDVARRLGFGADQRGALVTRVAPRSLAFRAGIRPGDVITKIGDQTVGSASEAKDAIAKQDLNKGVRLYVVSPTGSHFAFLQAKSGANGTSQKGNNDNQD